MGVAIATGMGVFATDGFIARLGLLELRNQHRAYVGGAFVLSTAMLGAQGLAAVAQMARRRYRRYRLETQSREALHALTPDEKATCCLLSSVARTLSTFAPRTVWPED